VAARAYLGPAVRRCCTPEDCSSGRLAVVPLCLCRCERRPQQEVMEQAASAGGVGVAASTGDRGREGGADAFMASGAMEGPCCRRQGLDLDHGRQPLHTLLAWAYSCGRGMAREVLHPSVSCIEEELQCEWGSAPRYRVPTVPRDSSIGRLLRQEMNGTLTVLHPLVRMRRKSQHCFG
jgi:hypothetical protein